MFQKFESREPTTAYGGRQSALRQISPHVSIGEQDSVYRQRESSPLRSHSPAQRKRQQNSITEEELFEERRGEELRRQIRIKEAELEQIALNKDRLKMRINTTLGFGATINPSSVVISRPRSPLVPTIQQQSYLNQRQIDQQSQLQNNENQSRNVSPSHDRDRDSLSPLRKKNHTHQTNQDRHEASHDYHHPIHDRSRSMNSTDNNQINLVSFQAIGQSIHNAPIVAQKHNDYIQQLQSDNTQLQRRLNLVLAEMDRVMREKMQCNEKYFSLVSQTQLYQKQIREQDQNDRHTDVLHEQIFITREHNKQVQHQIVESEQSRHEAITQLRVLQNERGRRVQDCEEMNAGLQHKVAVMKDIESDIFVCNNRIIDVSNQIRVLERQLQEDSIRQHDIQTIIDRLLLERNELNNKLDHLNRTYDHAVDEISRERAQIEIHNKRHTQILSSKAMFQSMEQMVLARKQASLNEFFNYCKFDQNCHRVLKRLSVILQKCGQFQMKIGLKIWFQNAFKPPQIRKQSSLLCQQLYEKRLKQRMFRIWIDRINSKGSFESDIQNAIRKIWRFKTNDVKWDIKRSFQIWRDHTVLKIQQLRRLKYLVSRQRNNLRRQALSLWKCYSVELDMAIRSHILSVQFASDQHKMIVMNNIKIKTSYAKKKRQMRIAHLWKAWNDSIAYRRYMMAQNVQAAHLRNLLQNKLASACLQALRQHKEVEKHQLILNSLTGDCQPHMEHLRQTIEILSESELKSRKIRALSCLTNHVMSYMSSYFLKWRRTKQEEDYWIQKNFKEMLFQKYLNTLQLALNTWRKGFNDCNQQVQKYHISTLDSEGKNLRVQNLSLGETIQLEKNRQDKNARTGLTRASNILKRRMLNFGIARWDTYCKKMRAREQMAGFLLKKKRKLLCDQSLEIYKEKVNQCKQDDRDQQRSEYYSETRNQRLKRKIFNSICQYVNQYSKSKRNLGVLFNNIDIWQKRKSLKLWADQGNLKREQNLRFTQNVHSQKFDELNQDLGATVNLHNDALADNKEMQNELIRQGQRILANVFARFYYIKAERGIKKWRRVVEFQRHLECLVNIMINHNRQRMLYFMKAALQNWISQCKISQTKASIKQTQIHMSDTIQMTQYNRKTFEAQQIQLQQETEDANKDSKQFNSLFSKTLNIIIRLNDDNYYQSKQRFLLNEWGDVTNRQVNFCKAIDKVVTKSLWQNGFTNINAFSRDKQLTRHQNVAIEDMRRLFWRKNCAHVISLWQTKHFSNTVNKIEQLKESIQDHTQTQLEQIETFQDRKRLTGRDVLLRMKQSQLLQCWQNVVKWKMISKSATSLYTENMISQNVREALKKWNTRSTLTIKCRNKTQLFLQRKSFMYMNSVFQGIKRIYQNEKKMCYKLSEIAAQFDDRMKHSAYDMIKHFSWSRKMINNLDKQVASADFGSMLNQLYLRKMSGYLSAFRVKVIDQKRKDYKIGKMFGYWYSKSLRERFFRWRDQAHKATTVIDVNQCGPVVEEVLGHQQHFQNLQYFMKDQGFPDKEIQQYAQKAKDYSLGQIQGTLAKLNHFTEEGDLYLKPKLFARWKLYVKMRKLVRYHLNIICNKLKPVKCDLQYAFNRWKVSIVKRYDFLQGADRLTLVDKVIDGQSRFNQLKKLETKAEQFLTTMGIQRDELIDNLLKSQRMGIALGRDNKERGLHRAFSAMLDNAHVIRRSHFEQLLQKNINFIQQLKEKIHDFECENGQLANENEELRQFSLDGYQIAKGVQTLSSERERLSVDLADKANVIKNLLDENELLTIKLKAQQESAMELIQKSRFNMQKMKHTAQQNLRQF